MQSVDPEQPLRPGAGRVPDALPRPPRGDDRAAHALHRLGGRPDRGLPGARGRLDGRAAGRAARPDARHGARLGRRVGRARAADRRVRGRCAGARAARVRRRPRPGAGGAARARRRGRRGGVGVPRPGRVPPAGRVRHLRALRACDAGRAGAGDPDSRGRTGPRGLRRRGGGRRHPQQGARAASGRVRRAARRGTPDLPAARRARRLQRHLGIRPDAPGGARGRAPRRRARADPRAGAPDRCRLRRDVLAGIGRVWSLRRRAGRPRHRAHDARAEGRSAVAGRPATAAAGRLRPAARRRRG